ncbi:squalene--hopene cyclase [Roseomonas elaeocarpi]|uniref:Squalene--hopene cyclase n=1 Tax=Roseomonas elaeocarpi TaxID=907779 RepID=A0ABV6JS03_9PROT
MTGADPLAGIEAGVHRAAEALKRLQREDGHWVFELEADATIPAEYILLRQHLAEPDDLVLERRIGNYLRRIQGAHGGWPLFHGGAFDISASVKAYFALKMIGDSTGAPHMVRAREAILAAGGAGASNVFTRILLALYGEVPWKSVPNMPVEMVLLPRWFPVHLSKMSYWARTVLVPLLVLQAKQVRARNPRGVTIQELFLPKTRRGQRQLSHRKAGWALFFNGLDAVLKGAEPLWPRNARERAIAWCENFVRERLNGEDGLGAIYPAMANSVMMFDALGYGEDHPDRAIARHSIEKLLVIREAQDEAYCQPCVSPVWDTALTCHALLEAGEATHAKSVERGLRWLKPLQELELRGDWAEEHPDLRPGGWAFQYRNGHYPDVDDTAVVVMAIDRARSRLGLEGFDEAVSRGAEWTAGMQSRNGGWGAFDADNDHGYLNNIPFADHGALLDPPTVDVSGRCVGMLAQLGEAPDSPRMRAAVEYLRRDQEVDGSWFGRWGVNYIYGTWSALCGLAAAGLGPEDTAVARGAEWLLSIQNSDGGWGEGCESYRLDYRGYETAPSNPCQTAWALLGLMAAGRVDDPAVERGVTWLLRAQDETGLWDQEVYTGGGFPRVFYLRYHGYARFFPLWAMARFRNLRRSNTQLPAWGL